MREIKFRGQRIDNKKWAYGYYYYDISSFSHLITAPIGRPPSFSEPAGENYNEHYEVDPKTVGQFTGRRNINGKEIYDGDILGEPFDNDGKTELSAIPVLWADEYSAWAVDLSFVKDGSYTELLYQKISGLTIRGNIHDNPELLTQV